MYGIYVTQGGGSVQKASFLRYVIYDMDGPICHKIPINFRRMAYHYSMIFCIGNFCKISNFKKYIFIEQKTRLT